jgi:3-methyl-2-oxobutanoate hydroxymethyltransferase
MTKQAKPLRITALAEYKRRGRKITMLTAYDAAMARLLDQAGIDVLLVGDSVGMVVMGHDTTIPVTMEAMVHHTRAVARGASRALIVADLPFLTYQVSDEEALRNAGRLIQDGGAAAVKIEGGRAVAGTAARMVAAGIPVMGHLGLTPQAVHQLGGFRPRPASETGTLVEDARLLEQAGAFALVLESMAPETARAITEAVTIPTIGIGAGPHCDGQVLVSYDAFGLFPGTPPPFVRQYARLGELMVEAAKEYIADVQEGRFP